MNKSPMNHLLTAGFVGVLWVLFGILMSGYLSEGPNLAEKDPTVLAVELRNIFGIGALLCIVSASFWYYYGAKEKVAGELAAAKKKWIGLFVVQVIAAVSLAATIIVINQTQGMEAKWFGIYFGILALLTFISFWLTTFLMSPRTVKFIPFGK